MFPLVRFRPIPRRRFRGYFCFSYSHLLAKTVTVTTRRGTQYHIKKSEAARLRAEGRADYLNADHTMMVETGVTRFDTCWQRKRSPNRPWGVPVLQYVP